MYKLPNLQKCDVQTYKSAETWRTILQICQNLMYNLTNLPKLDVQTYKSAETWYTIL